MGKTVWAIAIIGIILGVVYWFPKPILRHFNKYGIISIDTLEKRVALTIDDAPYGASFKKILEVLDKNNVKATFLTISDFITESDEQTIIDAMKNGHEFANHGKTNSVAHLLTVEQLEKEIDDCDAKLKELYEKAGVAPTGIRFYRPGSGLFNKAMLELIKDKQMELALGSVYPHDAIMPFSFINLYYLKYKIEPGDVIILHDRFWTVIVLEHLLPWLYWNDYTVQTLSEFVAPC